MAVCGGGEEEKSCHGASNPEKLAAIFNREEGRGEREKQMKKEEIKRKREKLN